MPYTTDEVNPSISNFSTYLCWQERGAMLIVEHQMDVNGEGCYEQ